jgi:hypothetical protein
MRSPIDLQRVGVDHAGSTSDGLRAGRAAGGIRAGRATSRVFAGDIDPRPNCLCVRVAPSGAFPTGSFLRPLLALGRRAVAFVAFAGSRPWCWHASSDPRQGLSKRRSNPPRARKRKGGLTAVCPTLGRGQQMVAQRVARQGLVVRVRTTGRSCSASLIAFNVP